MINETLYLIILGIAGIILDVLFKIKDWIENVHKRPKPILVIINLLISLIVTITLVVIREDIKSIYVVTPLGALMLGYLAHTLFRKFASIKSKEKPEDNE